MADTRSAIRLGGAIGQPVEIALEAVPGAGAIWIAPALPAGCALADGGRRSLDAGIGGAVLQCFVFSAVRSGHFVLEFAYKRPWESEVRAFQPVHIDIG
jgi:predicted secreted protein